MEKVFRRCLSSRTYVMQAWQATDTTGIKLETVPLPTMKKSSQVLIKVKASSVNPLDVQMAKGYGRDLLGKWKKADSCDLATSHFPVIPGRDCSGTVVAVGGGVHDFVPGDEVIAVVPAILQGTHAEYVVTEADYCAAKPRNLSFTEAAALPYVASTAYSALVNFARVDPKNVGRTRVLIHGGAGGVGSMAIQLLKAWGVDKVVATCSSDSFEAVQKLGAIPVDYRCPQATDKLAALAPFEVVLDTVDSELSRWSDNVMGVWRNCVHASIVSPLLNDTDRYGTPQGLLSTAFKHFNRSFQSSLRGRWYTYAFFMPSKNCMRQLADLAEEGKVVPIVERVVPFSEITDAYEKVGLLKGRGKTIIEMR
ncbi:unnamed protein product [Caenorhabditis auriculariae]|uniref:Enoyl reductase (ER) domain-containing protein n=1 Tax=Caenorhabditis auriculariae TaxID=2777116 RepID=A0A8S1GMF8_9PELO|nr:unnamed protein product [Caenorhabditis auriculariae]